MEYLYVNVISEMMGFYICPSPRYWLAWWWCRWHRSYSKLCHEICKYALHTLLVRHFDPHHNDGPLTESKWITRRNFTRPWLFFVCVSFFWTVWETVLSVWIAETGRIHLSGIPFQFDWLYNIETTTPGVIRITIGGAICRSRDAVRYGSAPASVPIRIVATWDQLVQASRKCHWTGLIPAIGISLVLHIDARFVSKLQKCFPAAVIFSLTLAT